MTEYTILPNTELEIFTIVAPWEVLSENTSFKIYKPQVQGTSLST